MSAALQGYPQQLMDFVCDAHENASFIEHQMKLIDGYEAQEVYLMQRFLWATLSGVRLLEPATTSIGCWGLLDQL